MRNSEIFDNFVKIAQEKGMISEDAPEKAKKALEQNPRWSSDTKEVIEKLYDLKPDSPKEMQYKKNIAEVAHPDPAVVSPAYDRLNGLVENINERQNILLHIVNKNNDGLLTQHRYAEKELILSLVRIGNNLDNQDKDELRILADACLFQVSAKPLKKLGFAAALLFNPITGIAAAFGALYAQQHLDNFSEGFEQNHQRLISELDDFLKSNDNFGVGVKYKPEFISMVQDFKNKLEDLNDAYQKTLPLINSFEMPKTDQVAKEIISKISDTDTQNAVKAYNYLRAKVKNLMPYIQQVARNFTNESYKARQIEEKGLITSLIDKTQVLHGGGGLISDDFDDVKHAIPPYLDSLKDIASVLSDATQKQSALQEQLQNADSKTDELFGNPESAPAPSDKGQLASVDKGAEDLERELSEIG